MERTILYQITPEDLRSFILDEIAKNDLEASKRELLKRYENTLIGVNEVAVIHNVSRATVRNYIDDGLIYPEARTVKNGKYKLRLSYVLTLDFEELKKQLKLKKLA
ncbi:MAG: hypothetical protein LBR26_09610 [Prevotella sp.]|jgi:predicted transcriptional regulator|nr:hypothetical protein [Prevotella sp.]